MQYLVVLPRAADASPTTLRKEDVESEAEYVRQLYADGIVRQIWLKAEGGACMIAEANDYERLQQLLLELPLVKSGYLAIPQISQIRPYSGFGPRQ